MFRRYAYVGPERIREATRGQPRGTPIDSTHALSAFLKENPDAGLSGATYTVDPDGTLRLAPRHSEHVACAGGGEVLAAGELVIGAGRVVAATNQSTGYCPEPNCWPALVEALSRAGVAAPREWTTAFEFRRCGCGQINLVKESWFFCAVCDAPLSPTWNLDGSAGGP